MLQLQYRIRIPFIPIAFIFASITFLFPFASSRIFSKSFSYCVTVNSSFNKNLQDFNYSFIICLHDNLLLLYYYGELKIFQT